MAQTTAAIHVVLLSAEERVDEYLSLGYLASSLQQSDLPVLTEQWYRDGADERILAAFNDAPGKLLVGVTWPYVFSERAVVHVAAWVKQHAPRATVAVGGHPVSQDYERILRTYGDIDVVVRGEGDTAVVELARALAEGADLASVAGLAWRSDGEVDVETSPPRAQIQQVDELPFPDRSTLAHVLDHYGNTDRVVVRMLGSRGCYAKCEFCSMVAFYSLDGTRMAWRRRSPQNLVAELRQVLDQFGVRRFWFGDDEFIGPPKIGVERIRRITHEILDADLGIEFGFDTRANGIAALTSDDLDGLYRAGLRVVAMGLESGSQAALKRLNKGMKVETNYEALRKLHAAGIDHRYGFIMYDRGSTLDDLAANVSFLAFADPSRICNTGPGRLLNAEFPEMGTPLYQKLNLDGLPRGVLDQDNFPKLHEDLLGYEFADGNVGRFRRILRVVAQETVEPTMIPRPKNEPAFTADTWWTGINYHPQNQAAMGAFLDCHSFLLDRLDADADTVLVDAVSDLYLQRFESHLEGRTRPASAGQTLDVA